MQTSWETEVAALLNELLGVQDEVLAMLGRKRDLLLAANAEGLAALAPEEAQLIERLQQYLQRRKETLAQAGQEGLPATSLRGLTAKLPVEKQATLRGPLQKANERASVLRHQGLVNWVVIQRTLIHLSQLLEIIATGGRLQPTYGRSAALQPSGNLVDHAA